MLFQSTFFVKSTVANFTHPLFTVATILGPVHLIRCLVVICCKSHGTQLISGLLPRTHCIVCAVSSVLCFGVSNETSFRRQRLVAESALVWHRWHYCGVDNSIFIFTMRIQASFKYRNAILLFYTWYSTFPVINLIAGKYTVLCGCGMGNGILSVSKCVLCFVLCASTAAAASKTIIWLRCSNRYHTGLANSMNHIKKCTFSHKYQHSSSTK